MNKNQITCDLCRDLIPLVKDGVASADSENAVIQHIENCPDCGGLFDGKIVPAVSVSESPKALSRVKRWLSIIYAVIMMLGICFGLSLTAGEDLFFNCLIMPIAGVFGYLVFRWKAFFAVPVVLIITGAVTNALDILGERLEPIDLVNWIFIYSLFALAGVMIAALFHFAFGKSKLGKEQS